MITHTNNKYIYFNIIKTIVDNLLKKSIGKVSKQTNNITSS